MKNSPTAKKIFLGILLLLGAACLILSGLGVEAGIFRLSFWQIIGGVACIYWIFGTIFFSRGADKLQIFFPLAFLFIIFEKEIAFLISSPKDNLIDNWMVLLAALLITIAIGFLSPKGHRHSLSFGSDSASEGTDCKNTFSEKQYYLDSTKARHSVKNSFGQLTVHFQNADIASDIDTIELAVDNSFGETNICAPADWTVIADIRSTFGDSSARSNSAAAGAKTLKVIGNNSFGEVNIL